MTLIMLFGSLIGWKDETTVNPPAGFTHDEELPPYAGHGKPIHISQEGCIQKRNGRSIIDWSDLAYGSPSGVRPTSSAPDVHLLRGPKR